MMDLDTLLELEEYLEGRADITSDGGPNKAMRLLQAVQRERRRLEREETPPEAERYERH